MRGWAYGLWAGDFWGSFVGGCVWIRIITRLSLTTLWDNEYHQRRHPLYSILGPSLPEYKLPYSSQDIESKLSERFLVQLTHNTNKYYTRSTDTLITAVRCTRTLLESLPLSVGGPRLCHYLPISARSVSSLMPIRSNIRTRLL